jgi:4-hydroxy-3-methylbut-2-enyl diphosphate reductase
MKIIRATHLGMCFGVRDAIALAFEHAKEKPLTILGELVHNESVLADLRENGIRIAQKISTVTTPTVMITAHGASAKAMQRVQDIGFDIIEATCPLVHYAHRMVKYLVQQKYHPVIIGKRDHVEVRGLTEDLEAFDVVLNEEDVERLPEHARFGIASQTTQPIDKVRHLVGLIRARFPDSEIRFIDTVCQPTKQRQSAAIELAGQCDVVIVIGGSNSNNTRELVATCQTKCPCVHHVQTADDVQSDWFGSNDTVGITAGTSTPDFIIDGVEKRIRELTAVSRRQLLHAHC